MPVAKVSRLLEGVFTGLVCKAADVPGDMAPRLSLNPRLSYRQGIFLACQIKDTHVTQADGADVLHVCRLQPSRCWLLYTCLWEQTLFTCLLLCLSNKSQCMHVEPLDPGVYLKRVLSLSIKWLQQRHAQNFDVPDWSLRAQGHQALCSYVIPFRIHCCCSMSIISDGMLMR